MARLHPKALTLPAQSVEGTTHARVRRPGEAAEAQRVLAAGHAAKAHAGLSAPSLPPAPSTVDLVAGLGRLAAELGRRDAAGDIAGRGAPLDVGDEEESTVNRRLIALAALVPHSVIWVTKAAYTAGYRGVAAAHAADGAAS